MNKKAFFFAPVFEKKDREVRRKGSEGKEGKRKGKREKERRGKEKSRERETGEEKAREKENERRKAREKEAGEEKARESKDRERKAREKEAGEEKARKSKARERKAGERRQGKGKQRGRRIDMTGREQQLNFYYSADARRLHRMVDSILLKFGGLSDKDRDDFYSLANEVFVDVLRRYNEEQSFEAFLQSCLFNRIKTEMTRRNCEKRRADRRSVSIDTPVGEGEELTLGDTIADSFDLETEVLGSDDCRTMKMERYLDRLSRRQRRVAELLTAAYGAGEIQAILQITPLEYADAMSGLRSYENVSLLF